MVDKCEREIVSYAQRILRRDSVWRSTIAQREFWSFFFAAMFFLLEVWGEQENFSWYTHCHFQVLLLQNHDAAWWLIFLEYTSLNNLQKTPIFSNRLLTCFQNIFCVMQRSDNFLDCQFQECTLLPIVFATWLALILITPKCSRVPCKSYTATRTFHIGIFLSMGLTN